MQNETMPFIILDRDGVINYESELYIKSPDEWIPIPGSLAAIAKLNQAGFRVIVATNQSGVGRKLYDLEILAQIHEKLMRELAEYGGSVEEIFYCPHHPDENCACRKPKVGLLQQIQEKYPINFTQTFFIGDSHVDVIAAKEVGCIPLLVLTGKGENTLRTFPDLKTIPHFNNLAEAVDYVLQLRK